MKKSTKETTGNIHNHRPIAVWRNPHLWYITAIMIVCSTFYYFGEIADLMGWQNLQWDFLYTVHDLHRIPFLILVLYSAYAFRLRGVIITTSISLLIFLPRAIFISSYPEPLLRMLMFVILTVGIGIVLSLLLGSITKLRQVQAKLRESEQNFHNTLDDSPLGVRIIIAEGELLYANQAILDIYGYSNFEELKTTPTKQHYTSESYAEHRKRREDRKLGKPIPDNYEIGIVRKGGEVRYLQVFRREVIWNGKTQFMAFYQDITNRKRQSKRNGQT